jgi:Tol biopolymer transport system component
LAFVRGGDIWTKDLDSDEELQLTEDGNNIRPRWSANGQWIAFQKTTPVDSGFTQVSLWTMRADGSQPTEIDAFQTFPPVWSPSENRLAYAKANGGLWVVDADGSNRLELLSPTDKQGPTGTVWSPDGDRLAVERRQYEESATPSAAEVAGQGLWLFKMDGTDPEELYSAWDPENLTGVTHVGPWSSDGRWIAFWRGTADPTARANGLPVLVISADGGSPKDVAAAAVGRESFLAWSPAGDKIAVVEGEGRETWANKHIVVVSADGSKREVVSDELRADLAPAWSPDGSRIAFVSQDAAPPSQPAENYPRMLLERAIWVMNADGTDKAQLTDDPAYGDDFPQWSADGQHILFVRQPEAAINQAEGQAEVGAEVWLTTASGNDQRKVVDDLSGAGLGYFGYLDWGQRLDWDR